MLYADPYLGEGYGEKADLVIISHEHHDHTKTDLVTLKEGGVILRSAYFTDGVSYRTAAVGDFTVTAVPAYNRNHNRAECVGFVIDVDGKRVYASGDTSKTDYMRTLADMHIDYALLCCDGVYNMNAAEASECAAIIGAGVNIPYHTYPEHLFSEAVAAKFSAKGKRILHPSEEIEL